MMVAEDSYLRVESEDNISRDADTEVTQEYAGP